ncbi:tetratricopeptide repeat protein [Salinarimonas sp. NSM]|uniref:tetratricopeptide repeat protein n=1 Tax=Salinarimonas sp. NSM TaxID=3458003 RepID=UPI004036A9DF
MKSSRRRVVAVIAALVALVVAVLVLQRVEQRRAAAWLDARLAAYEAFDAGAYAHAAAALAPLSQGGDGPAMRRLARLYADGLGVTRDRERARALYTRAAEAGEVAALLPLARLIEAEARRSGAAEDWREARDAYERAFAAGAAAGAAEAATRLAELHAAGDGVPASDVDAAHWYRRAAGARDPAAQLRLGLLYAEGRGVPEDPVRAHAWLNVAVARLPAGEIALRETALAHREAIERRLDAAERAEARRLAHDLFE